MVNTAYEYRCAQSSTTSDRNQNLKPHGLPLGVKFLRLRIQQNIVSRASTALFLDCSYRSQSGCCQTSRSCRIATKTDHRELSGAFPDQPRIAFTVKLHVRSKTKSRVRHDLAMLNTRVRSEMWKDAMPCYAMLCQSSDHFVAISSHDALRRMRADRLA